jgi:hypothetical protein
MKAGKPENFEVLLQDQQKKAFVKDVFRVLLLGTLFGFAFDVLWRMRL